MPGATWRELASTWTGVGLLSLSAVFVRLADVEPARSAFLRGLYALPAFAAMVWWQRRRREKSLRGALVPLAVLAGVFLGADLLAWHASIGIIGAGLATVIPNLQVVFVGITGALVFGERPHGAFWAALPVVLLGVWMLAAAGEPLEPAGSVPLGVGLGVLTGIFYAGYLVLLRIARLRASEVTSIEAMASATLGAAAIMGVFAALEGVAGPAGSLEADGWLVALALGNQVLAWVLVTASIHRLPAALTSVALLLQPVLALGWGALLLGEPLGPAQLAGSAVVLGGVAAAHRAVVVGERRVAETERAATSG
jgi:drug/metabolite transporter (DMT)-like permease